MHTDIFSNVFQIAHIVLYLLKLRNSFFNLEEISGYLTTQFSFYRELNTLHVELYDFQLLDLITMSLINGN
jgi:hypothetical protein